MRSQVHCVDENQGTDLVCGLNDFVDGIDRSRKVRSGTDSDQSS